MENKVGIQNLKEAVIAGIKSYEVLAEAKANDGKIDFKDIYLIAKIAPYYSAAFADINQVVPEAKDLSAEEIAELSAAVLAELGGLPEKRKMQIEKVLVALKANYDAVKSFA